MHNKTVKFITQLRHATHGKRHNIAKYPNYQLISQPKLDKLQLQYYSKCFSCFPRSNADVCASDRKRRGS